MRTRLGLCLIAASLLSCGTDNSDRAANGALPSGGVAGAAVDGSAGAQAGAAGTAPADAAGIAPADDGPQGGPGCGLAAAAFCDTFGAPAATQGRAGELNALLWSAGRLDPQLPTANGNAFGIGPATLPTCRANLPAQVFPDQDTLICDPSDSIAAPHLLVAVAAQNYGQNTYRIRQPFDFSGRTGTITFDAEAYMINSLLGWISVEITPDPINVPSYAVGGSGVYNDEGSVIPENAIEFQFSYNCNSTSTAPQVALGAIIVTQEYSQTTIPSCPWCASIPCINTQQGNLNHFQLAISQSNVDVSATDFSTDGVNFPALTDMFSTSVNLPFTRGYVHITTHNHATIKYSNADSWIARWGKVGFDGPIVSNWREYSVPDSLIAGQNETDAPGPVTNVGYVIADVSSGPAQTLELAGVDTSNVSSASISISSWYNNGVDNQTISQYMLQFRLNGGAWNQRPLTAGELGVLTGGNNQGVLAQMLDVPLSDLVSGDNTLEFVTQNVAQDYPSAIANVDLILTQ